MSDVIIVGGGVSGLTTAYFLSRKGISSTLIEARPRVGGLIKTDVLHGCQLEAGPDSYIATKPSVTELAREIPDLADQVIGTNDANRRVFLVKNGKLTPLPSGMVMIAPRDMRPVLESDFFSAQTKSRFLEERFLKPRERTEDISIADFVLDHFDQSVLEYIAEPLLTGVYGGEARQLSARSVLPRFMEYERRFGSLIRGVRSERKNEKAGGSMFLSFKNGMQALTDALSRRAGQSDIRIHSEVKAIRKQRAGWVVQTDAEEFSGQNVVLAVPAHRAAAIVSDSLPSVATGLGGIPYTSAITVVLVYRREQIQHPLDGFGFLVPRSERRQVAAATWINTKLPLRISPEWAALRAFIVDRDADDLMGSPDQEIIAAVRREFNRLMGIDAQPAFHTLYRWPQSMPQYIVGHQQRLAAIHNALRSEKGLWLAGNAYEGVGIPDCVRIARQVADEINA